MNTQGSITGILSSILLLNLEQFPIKYTWKHWIQNKIHLKDLVCWQQNYKQWHSAQILVAVCSQHSCCNLYDTAVNSAFKRGLCSLITFLKASLPYSNSMTTTFYTILITLFTAGNMAYKIAGGK